jgi:hypothetical protein
MLSHVQDGIEYLQIRQADVGTLPWQAVLDLRELGCGDLYATTVAPN